MKSYNKINTCGAVKNVYIDNPYIVELKDERKDTQSKPNEKYEEYIGGPAWVEIESMTVTPDFWSLSETLYIKITIKDLNPDFNLENYENGKYKEWGNLPILYISGYSAKSKWKRCIYEEIPPKRIFGPCEFYGYICTDKFYNDPFNHAATIVTVGNCIPRGLLWDGE